MLVLRAGKSEFRIAWEDVARLNSGGEVRVVLGEGASPFPAVLEGSGDGEVVAVSPDGTSRTIGLSAITALNPPPPVPPLATDWAGTTTVGATANTGNADSVALSSRLSISHRGPEDRVTLKGNWDYISTEEGISDRRLDGEGRYDYFFEKQVFLYVSHKFEHALAKQLELRYTGSVGGGYQFIESTPLALHADLGLAYVNEDFKPDRSVSPPESKDKVYGALRSTFSFSWRLREGVVFTQELSTLAGVQDTDDFSVRSDTALRVDFVDPFGITLSIITDYDNTPGAGKRRTDVIYTAGLSYSF
jgi:putative salt-induced outer membrane protein